MWILVPNGASLKITGGDALCQVVPMTDVTVLPSVPPPVTAPAQTQVAPVIVSPGTSPVAAQVIKP